MGTLHFIAPEMVHPNGAEKNEFRFGGSVGLASDIWSLGISFYTILYGRFPEKHTHIRDPTIIEKKNGNLIKLTHSGILRAIKGGGRIKFESKFEAV